MFNKKPRAEHLPKRRHLWMQYTVKITQLEHLQMTVMAEWC